MWSALGTWLEAPAPRWVAVIGTFFGAFFVWLWARGLLHQGGLLEWLEQKLKELKEAFDESRVRTTKSHEDIESRIKLLDSRVDLLGKQDEVIADHVDRLGDQSRLDDIEARLSDLEDRLAGEAEDQDAD